MRCRANDPQRREKIIQATLEAVKLYGIHAVTHRKKQRDPCRGTVGILMTTIFN